MGRGSAAKVGTPAFGRTHDAKPVASHGFFAYVIATSKAGGD
jgi:hypothetical protein